ncbi:retinol dehydrogenase 14-like [Mercenaria mercenaria]|uniref:retinol dehydrogenase 14-like n=1 Tax=Mercenaria mercenaria TaxID=6596 RepID=UPI001E1D57B0|nr:retinol dehydrogenase 14-like [Mercenaria mercenaria]
MGAKQSFPREQIPQNRTFVVTGANRGIGYEIAKWIAMLGGTVVMACRSEDETMKAMRQMDQEYKEEKAKGTEGLVDVPELSLVFMELDLSSFKSTKAFVQAYKDSGRPLHVLICNAGISKAKPEQTEDGFEFMLQVNYLSHFLMIGQLLPMMKKNESETRIVLVSSDAHKMCGYNLEAINYQGDPSNFGVLDYYGRSKLYQIMQMHCLHRRLRNSNISVTSAHPGMVETKIGAEFKDRTAYQLFLKMSRLVGVMRTPIQGATTIINSAVNPDLKSVSGVYFKDCQPASTTSVSRDEVKQEELWNKTLEFLKGHFTEEEIYCLEGADPTETLSD